MYGDYAVPTASTNEQGGNDGGNRGADPVQGRAGPGWFLGTRLIALPDGEWLDIVEWRSPADFAASRAKGANVPGIAAIDELVGIEEGTLA